MATALLLWSSSKEKKQENPENAPPSGQASKPESSKHRSRRASKQNASSGAPKRPPQRGLGVAQLERLRLQDPGKKNVESDPSQAHNLQLLFPFSVSDPPGNLSFGPFPPTNYTQMRGQIGNGGFPVVGREFSVGSGEFPLQPAADRLRSPASSAHEVRFPMARELPSTQMPQLCMFNQCEACAKEERIQRQTTQNPLNGWSSSSRFPDAEMDGCNFLGLNLGGGRAVDRGSMDFGGRGGWCGGSSGMHVFEELVSGPTQVDSLNDPPETMENRSNRLVEQGVDVAALAQRKGKWVGEGILKEYDFFPGKESYNNNSYSSSRRGAVSVTAVSTADAVAGEAYSPSPSYTGYLDLSLKL
ncbi:hypothetical protein ACLOJK_039754 [Asimina triloba]